MLLGQGKKMSYYDIIFVALFLATVLCAVVLYYGHNLCW